jgi:hypothetical protein
MMAINMRVDGKDGVLASTNTAEVKLGKPRFTTIREHERNARYLRAQQ